MELTNTLLYIIHSCYVTAINTTPLGTYPKSPLKAVFSLALKTPGINEKRN